MSTINRDLAALRRMFHLAQEWGRVGTVLPKVRLLPGENQLERVLSADEDNAYLNAATKLGRSLEQAYRQALKGIRATAGGEQPRRERCRVPDGGLDQALVTQSGAGRCEPGSVRCSGAT